MVGRDAPYPLESDPSGRAHSPAPEDAALRRVATLVAEGVQPAELFATVAREIVQVVDVREAALLRYEADRSATVVASVNAPDFPIGRRWSDPGSLVGVPIVVEGGVWGLICAGPSATDEMPPEVEARVRDFTELVAIAISNADSRDRLRRLADQQASLRRVATLVAEGRLRMRSSRRSPRRSPGFSTSPP